MMAQLGQLAEAVLQEGGGPSEKKASGLKTIGSARSLQHHLQRTIRLPAIAAQSSSASSFNRPAAVGSDFYRAVNGAWFETTRIPEHLTSYSVSEEIEGVIQKFLWREVSGAAAGSPMGALAASALNPSAQKRNIEDLREVLGAFRCMRIPEAVAAALGTLCRQRISTLIDVFVGPRDGGSKYSAADYCVHLSIGSVGLPDVVYYGGGRGASGTSSVLSGYVHFIKEACRRLETEDFSSAVPFEAKLAAAAKAAEAALASKPSVFMRLPELKRKCPRIPWDSWVAAFAPGAPESLCFQVESVPWLQTLDHLFSSVSPAEWSRLLALHTLLHAAPFLPPPFDDMQFKVFGRRLAGQREKTPQPVLVLNTVKERLPFDLGAAFVQKYLPADFKDRAMSFVNTIQAAAARRLRANHWMSPAARRRAAEKVERMELSVGYSGAAVTGRFRPAIPALDPARLLKNVYSLDEAVTDFEVAKLSRNLPRGFWQDPPYIVNAYYYHETNEIVVPGGNFLWPFFREEAAIGWNYGAVGSIVAHEIVHAFDGEGRLFDAAGRMEPWWSPADERRYEAEVKKLVRLFDSAPRVGGQKISGAATLDENLADLGGVAIALEALKGELEAGHLDEATRLRHMREFFIAYAMSWRTKEHGAKALQRVITDQHAPFELRVNFIVPHFQEWYDAFGVDAGAALWIAPADRIRIF
jgi:putative endopeptidase